MPRAPLHSWSFFLSIVALTGLLAACGAKQQGGMPKMPPPEVTVVTLKQQPVDLRRELPGRVSARLVAEVRPQVSGLVRKMMFTEGAQVKAGQVLYQLDDATYRAAYNSADADQQRADAALQAARLAANRGTELSKSKLISAQDNDNLQSTFKQAEAQVAAARASVESNRVNLAYARVTSPISGRIGKSAVTEGALVVASQAQPLATVQQLDQVYVDVTQSSGEWLQLRRDLGGGDAGKVSRAASITLEDGSHYAHDGVLQFSDVTVDQNTGSFLLRVLVPNPESLLMPGMYVKATISEGQLESGLLAPQQGVTRDPKGNATAMVVGADNKVEMRNVSVSRTVGDQWLVSDGLKAGDRVIVEGLQKIQPGVPVRPAEAGAAPAAAAAPVPGAPGAAPPAAGGG
jgi:membrane fusion protein (multidrug efflux system)